MNKELIIKRCLKCNATILVLEDCHCEECGITCCNQPMSSIIPNATEASIEKHLPTYKIEENKLKIQVNHVMEEEHHINWIAVVQNNEVYTKYLTQEDSPEVVYPYQPNTEIYAYCNKHGLWKTKVESDNNG